jgi:hypothetical protein
MNKFHVFGPQTNTQTNILQELYKCKRKSLKATGLSLSDNLKRSWEILSMIVVLWDSKPCTEKDF